MDADGRIRYQLRELEMARNPELPGFEAPPLGNVGATILDVGCGIGQTFLAGEPAPGSTLVGIDVDAAVLAYGRSHFEGIAYVNAAAERLPFADGSFDRVISRVCLPYTDIPTATREIGRVLRDGGVVWMTLHAFPNAWRHFGRSVRKLRAKDAALRLYVIANGAFLHLFGRVVRLPVRNYRESCQSERAIVRALRDSGFEDIVVQRREQFIVTAIRRKR